MLKHKLKLPALLGPWRLFSREQPKQSCCSIPLLHRGAQRTLAATANYANPTGNIRFALSAGIDRKVKIQCCERMVL